MNDINEFESARENNLIDYLRSAISDGAAGLTDAPSLLRQIIEGGLWRKRFVPQTKELVRFGSFDEFIAAAPPEGLGVSKRLLYKICPDDTALLDLLDRTLKSHKWGGDRRSEHFKHDIVTIENQNNQRGNTKVYALRRLREIRPDLHRKVLEKDLSVNQAMLEAGLRKKSMVVAADVVKICAAIKTNFTDSEILEIIDRLKRQ